MPYEFLVPGYLEYLAAFAWAASGTIVGIRKGYDFVGVFVVALLSSFGGGLLRDGLFLHRTPVVVENVFYIPLVLATTVIISLAWRPRIRNTLRDTIPDSVVGTANTAVEVIDAIGTPAFVIVGLHLSLAAGIPLPGVLLIGAINGTGGGILRDIIVGDPISVLKPGVYGASLLILLSSLYLIVTLLVQPRTSAVAWGMVVLFFVLRMLVLRYNVRTRPIIAPDA